MTVITGSRTNFLDADNTKVLEFLTIVQDIIALPEYQQLKEYTHHIYMTRYQHCLNVAWYSYLMAKKMHLDYISCTRGAMLHDFYFYDHNHGVKPLPGKHSEVHPIIALANAEKYFEVNDVMKDCIVHHMWPVTHVKPKTKEGMIITLADKYSASVEWMLSTYVHAIPYLQRCGRMLLD